METFDCVSLTITKNGKTEALHYASAILYVHEEEDSFKSWFLDITSIENEGLIDKLLSESDIHIYMHVLTKDGKPLEGEGYIHPNLSGQNATIRGNGELIGYGV